MQKTQTILAIVGLVVMALAAVFVSRLPAKAPAVLSFQDCAKAGYPVLESYPRQCKTPDGRTFAEEIVSPITYSNASPDLITVELPTPDSVTSKSFSVVGQARGNWFFEGSFSVELLDQAGKVVSAVAAKSQGEWMTTNFVPFRAEITAPKNYTGPATLVLKKSNPSDLPENDASISFPITIEY